MTVESFFLFLFTDEKKNNGSLVVDYNYNFKNFHDLSFSFVIFSEMLFEQKWTTFSSFEFNQAFSVLYSHI